jgi:hypothetical protein
LLLPLAAIVGAGCDELSEPAPKVGVSNWKVSSAGGPIKLRALPPADRVLADYDAWLDSEAATNARVYQATLVGGTNQLAFKVDVSRGETPLGRPEHTYVSFIYRDHTNGSYELSWHRLGRHNADFLKLDNRPRMVWLMLNRMASDSTLPKLEIVALEGVKLGGVVIAEPGRPSK